MIHCSYTYEKTVGSVKRYIGKALELAEFSDCRKRHGCVIVKHGAIIARGWNKHRNDPNIMSPEHILTGSSVHAEMMALRSAGDRAKGSDLYVVRLGARGAPLLSRPCLRCYTSIITAGIQEVYHT